MGTTKLTTTDNETDFLASKDQEDYDCDMESRIVHYTVLDLFIEGVPSGGLRGGRYIAYGSNCLIYSHHLFLQSVSLTGRLIAGCMEGVRISADNTLIIMNSVK